MTNSYWLFVSGGISSSQNVLVVVMTLRGYSHQRKVNTWLSAQLAPNLERISQKDGIRLHCL